MFHVSHYGKVALSAKAWSFVDTHCVHINMREDQQYGSPLGYMSITAEQARILAHQLQVAAEQCDIASQQAEQPQVVTLAAAA